MTPEGRFEWICPCSVIGWRAMKLGCSGCLALILILAVASLLVGGAVGAAVRMLAHPDVRVAPSTAADGARAQQKLFDLARQARRGETIALSEAEVNALI